MRRRDRIPVWPRRRALGPGPGFDDAAGRRQLAPPIAVLAPLLRSQKLSSAMTERPLDYLVADTASRGGESATQVGVGQR